MIKCVELAPGKASAFCAKSGDLVAFELET